MPLRLLAMTFSVLLAAPVLAAPPEPPAEPDAPQTKPERSTARLTPAERSTRRIAAAQQAFKDGQTQQWQAQLEDELLEAVADPKSLDAANVIELASQLEIARATNFIRDHDTLAWLVAQPRLRHVLPLLWGRHDIGPSVVSVLKAIRQSPAASNDKAADLIAALAVVWDQPAQYKRGRRQAGDQRVDATRPVILLEHFTKIAEKAAVDPLTRPAPLAVYFVDVAVSAQELDWAAERYASRKQIGNVYHQVRIDSDHMTYGEQTQLGNKDYTLPNILQYAGSPYEQAWFATQVSKACGVPAVLLQAQTPQAQQFWVGYLLQGNRHARWTFHEGRKGISRTIAGRTHHPQTGQPVYESQLAMLDQLLKTPEADRHLAIALLRASEITATDERPVDRTALILRAVELSPGDQRVWRALGRLGRDEGLEEKTLEQAMALVERGLVPQSPDFAMEIYADLIGKQSIKDQGRYWSSIARTFRQRPDLQTRVLLRQADLLNTAGAKRPALRLLKQALPRARQHPAVLADAIDVAQRILEQPQTLRSYATTIRDAWTKMTVPDRSPYMKDTIWHALGERLAAVYDAVGDQASSEKIQTRMENAMRLPRNPKDRRVR